MFVKFLSTNVPFDSVVNVHYTAQQLKSAYLHKDVVAREKKVKIAIVIAYTYPNVQKDLDVFWTSPNGMNLQTAAPTLIIHTMPGATQDGGWAQEECLDVQMVCAMNPNAEIHVIEATSSSYGDLFVAVTHASSTVGADVLSMSWGSDEFPRQDMYNTYFSNPNICYCAASGDSNSVCFPATCPNVIAVGGTSLNTIADGKRTETSWTFAGSGYSKVYKKPLYQSKITPISNNLRAIPDVALVANPNTGVLVCYNGGWYVFGGTSVSTPIFAAIVSLGVQMRLNNNAGTALTSVVSCGSTSINIQNNLYQTLYSDNKGVLYSSIFNDIISGTDGIFNADSGYDFATGLGSPNITFFITNLSVI